MATMSTAFAAPPRVHDSPKKFRFLSLAEARAIALERGNIGQPSLLYPGTVFNSSVVGPQGEAAFPMRVCCKPGSKCLILTSAAKHPRPAELERTINQLLLNIENAYWNLYGSYWQLNSREQGLCFAEETLKIARAQYRAGRIGQSAVAQAEGQYNLFRSQRQQAIDDVCDDQRQLFAMIGLPIEDGTWLVPCESPTLVEKKPDWDAALHRTVEHRPELRLAERDVLLAQWRVAAAKAACEVAGTPAAATQCKAKLEQAALREARARQVLSDQALKAERFLGLYYRRMSSAYSQIKAAQAQREAFATQLEIRYQLFRVGANEPGTGNPVTLNLLLEAQRFWAEALSTEYQAIVTYNNSLAGWEYAQGGIMRYAHVRIAKEAPGDGEFVPAVERVYKRTRQHVRRESALVANSPLTAPDACRNGENDKATSLVALWKCCPPLKQDDEAPSSDRQVHLVAWKMSDIFPSHNVHKTH
jgi:hypothetical protein